MRVIGEPGPAFLDSEMCPDTSLAPRPAPHAAGGPGRTPPIRSHRRGRRQGTLAFAVAAGLAALVTGTAHGAGIERLAPPDMPPGGDPLAPSGDADDDDNDGNSTNTSTATPTFLPTQAPTQAPTIELPMLRGPVPPWMAFTDLVFFDRRMDSLNHTFNSSQMAEISGCLNLVQVAVKDLIAGTNNQAAYNMFNAWGLYPGSTGNYYECTSAGSMFCTLNVTRSASMSDVYFCVPSECTVPQLEMIRDGILPTTMKDVTEYDFGDTVCIESDYSGIFPLAAVFLGFIAMVSCISTIIDMWVARPTLGNDDDEVGSPWPLGSSRLSVNETAATLKSEDATSLIKAAAADSKTLDDGADDEADRACYYFVGTFSALQSYRKLVAAPQYGRALRTLDGIRVVSMLWLIMGQTLLIQIPLLDSSRFILAQLRATTSFQLVLNASLATDTFLLVSGMVAMYKMLQRFSRRSTPRGFVNVTFSIIGVMLKRVSRLLPLLVVTMVFYVLLLPSLLAGPNMAMWLEHPDYASCATTWWQNLLFINNLYVTPSDADAHSLGCMGWTWYLGLDMQLHLLAPVFALMFWYYGLLALLVCAVLTLLSVGNIMWVIKANDLQGCPSDFMDWQYPDAELLTKPWTRAVPYLLGFILAFWFNAIGDEAGARNIARIRPVRRAVLLTITGLLLAIPVFITADMYADNDDQLGECNWGDSQNFAYLALSRVSFSLGMFLFTLCCLTGWAGWLTNVLCLQVWAPLSRLVYGVYLVHPIVLETVIYSSPQLPQITLVSFLMLYTSTCCLSFAVSALLYCLFDGPISNVIRSCSRRTHLSPPHRS